MNTFEIKGDIKKLSMEEGDILVVQFKDPRLFRTLLQMDHNPLVDNLKKAVGEKTKVLLLPPGLELTKLNKKDLEGLE